LAYWDFGQRKFSMVGELPLEAYPRGARIQDWGETPHVDRPAAGFLSGPPGTVAIVLIMLVLAYLARGSYRLQMVAW
jgi:hypothetical protein